MINILHIYAGYRVYVIEMLTEHLVPTYTGTWLLVYD